MRNNKILISFFAACLLGISHTVYSQSEGELFPDSVPEISANLFKLPHYCPGWSEHHLLGRVKSYKTSTGDEIHFNQDGNVTYIKYKPYSNSREYLSKDSYIVKGRYSFKDNPIYINFPMENIRLEGEVGKWKEGRYYSVYIFSSPQLRNKMMKWMAKDHNVELVAEYEHAYNWWKPFPVRESLTWTDDEGNYKAYYHYKYLEFDETGNWTLREVSRIIYWHKDYTDRHTGEHYKYSHRDRMQYTETTRYEYFDDNDITADYKTNDNNEE